MTSYQHFAKIIKFRGSNISNLRPCLSSRYLSSISSSEISRTNQSSSPTSRNNDAQPYVSPLGEFFHQVETNTTRICQISCEPPPIRYLECGIAENKIEYITGVYGRLQLAPHVQKWEHRVKLRVHWNDMNLNSQIEKDIVREIVGPRLRNQVLQLASNQFGSRIENKRHLDSMLNRIVLGAKRLALKIEQDQEESKEVTLH
jgi:Mitochondrial ribosomal subunit protein